MSQVQKLFFELNNERNLKEQFLRERNDTLGKYKECQADTIALHKQVEEMQKALEFYANDETYTGIYRINGESTLITLINFDAGDIARQALKGDPK